MIAHAYISKNVSYGLKKIVLTPSPFCRTNVAFCLTESESSLLDLLLLLLLLLLLDFDLGDPRPAVGVPSRIFREGKPWERRIDTQPAPDDEDPSSLLLLLEEGYRGA